MGIVTLSALVVIALHYAIVTERTVIEVSPFVLCGVGVLLYFAAFFNLMSAVELLLIALAAIIIVRAVVRGACGHGWALSGVKAQLSQPYLWGCAVLLAVVCVMLRGEMILEWDGYNFWGPDVKSLYFRDGFAPMHSNAAQDFGDYTPMAQLIWCFFVRMAGRYDEQFVFFGYYAFGCLMLFSAAAPFARRRGKARFLAAVLVPVCAFLLPGVASTSWYRALFVDPMMALLFGLMLCRISDRPEGHRAVWRAELAVMAFCLCLMKSMGLLWCAFAAIFYFIWYFEERRERLFSGAVLASSAFAYVSWSVYCAITERTGYLSAGFGETVADRLSELAGGTFWTTELNRAYLESYFKAFFVTPIHREWTFGVDLTPFGLILLIAVFWVLLAVFGFAPKGKLGRAVTFSAIVFTVIYTFVTVGQLTLFYTETGYTDPVKAVTLMSRYSDPANVGLLMLVLSFASRGGEERCTVRSAVACALVAALIISSSAYCEIYRRFVYDELDAQRTFLRREYESEYADFAQACEAVPLDEASARVMLVLRGSTMSPIVTNMVSPVSFAYVSLKGEATVDYERLIRRIEESYSGYVYFMDCSDEMLSLAGEGLSRGVLYKVEEADGVYSFVKP